MLEMFNLSRARVCVCRGNNYSTPILIFVVTYTTLAKLLGIIKLG